MAAPTVEQVQADISAATMLISTLLESTTDTVTIGAGKQLLTLGGSMKGWLEANKDALRGEPGEQGPMGDPGDVGDPGDMGPLGEKGSSWTVAPTATIAIDPSLDIPTIAMAYSSPNPNYEFDLALAITVKLPNWKIKKGGIPILPEQPNNVDVSLYATQRNSTYPTQTAKVWSPGEAALRTMTQLQAMPTPITAACKYLDVKKRRICIGTYRWGYDIWMRGTDWDWTGWASQAAVGDDVWVQADVDAAKFFPAFPELIYSPNKGGKAALYIADTSVGWRQSTELSTVPQLVIPLDNGPMAATGYVVFEDCTYSKDAGVSITAMTALDNATKPLNVGSVHNLLNVGTESSPKYIAIVAPATDGGKFVLIDPALNKLGEIGDATEAGDVFRDIHIQSKERAFAFTDNMDVYEINITAMTAKKIFTNDTGLKPVNMIVDGYANRVVFTGIGFYMIGDVTDLGTNTKFTNITAHEYPIESSPIDSNNIFKITDECLMAPNQTYDAGAPVYDHTKPIQFLGTEYDGYRRISFTATDK